MKYKRVKGGLIETLMAEPNEHKRMEMAPTEVREALCGLTLARLGFDISEELWMELRRTVLIYFDRHYGVNHNVKPWSLSQVKSLLRFTKRPRRSRRGNPRPKA